MVEASHIIQGTSIPLVVEVVSTNGRDDDLKKLADYEVISIPVISEWLNHRGHRGHREREERDNNSDVNGFDIT